jgi:citrate lyase beta subunit
MVDPRYVGIRSIMETPIVNDHKWSKIPDIPADMFFLDMEDSVPPALKEEARKRVVHYIKNPEFFEGRPTIARPNHLSTPWGRADLEALAESGVTLMTYPKVNTVEELAEVRAILREGGSDPDMFVLVESARAVLEVAKLAAADKVHALMFGAGDLTVDSGITLLTGPDQELNPALIAPKVQTVLAGAAFGCLTVDIAYMPDIRDLVEARRRYQQSRDLGFTGGATFYPPHVELVNEVFSPSREQIDHADEIIGVYETGLANGDPSIIHNGRALLVHDYEKALGVRTRQQAIAR